MSQYLTYMHLLTPLHTGASANEGNLMGIAREVHTEFPYLPSSSLRGKIRSELEQQEALKDPVNQFFGQKIKGGNQPTEGEVWFADATLLFFPIASLSHHLVWVTCPLWLDRWSRWLGNKGGEINSLAQESRKHLTENNKSAVTSFSCDLLYLQTALLKRDDICEIQGLSKLLIELESFFNSTSILNQLTTRLIIINDEDCISLVESGLQREVRIALDEQQKTVKGGSFRSEEAIPPEAVLFFPWGVKVERPFLPNSSLEVSKLEAERIKHQQKLAENSHVHDKLVDTLKERLQFGGLEGLGRGWAKLETINVNEEAK